MKRCIFCGGRAPQITKEKGVFKMHCSCGMKIEDTNRDNVVWMWNYEPEINDEVEDEEEL